MKKKPRKRPVVDNNKICERCGNGGFTRKTMFRCRYCGWMNGLGDYNVEVTKGHIDDR